MRSSIVLCCSLFYASAPAAATELWECSVDASPSFGAIASTPGQLQIQIEGNDLLWITPNFTVRGREYPGNTQHRPIIVNNEIGAVAVSGVATTAAPKVLLNGRSNAAFSAFVDSTIPNPRVEAYATVLDKQNGTLRVGSVGTTKVQEISIGKCTKGAVPPPTTSPK